MGGATSSPNADEPGGKDLIRAFFDRLNSRDFDGAAVLMADDCVHHACGLGGIIHGADAWRRFVRSLWQSFPDRAIEIHQMIAEGERVAVRLTWTGTHQANFAQLSPTGRAVEVNGMSVFVIRDGKIVEQWIEQDILKLHQDLGAAPGYSDNWPRLGD